jgi:hypothetical protein
MVGYDSLLPPARRHRAKRYAFSTHQLFDVCLGVRLDLARVSCTFPFSLFALQRTTCRYILPLVSVGSVGRSTDSERNDWVWSPFHWHPGLQPSIDSRSRTSIVGRPSLFPSQGIGCKTSILPVSSFSRVPGISRNPTWPNSWPMDRLRSTSGSDRSSWKTRRR